MYFNEMIKFSVLNFNKILKFLNNSVTFARYKHTPLKMIS